ncbi:PQQ-binding-like beta-propeller repeat protein [Micromonospora sp. C28SCA-DRY-2]|uniref:outer membrane protein assembly factor BamB family protein n=1 Tax=Micromonospora sp. C28SCA-DRY-2 TaxID=3059522 RepID=UPI0026763153|nr:PQQ-binding-like beta-propeller repeat protein [Micromonospora sp. C28SCA-DRY-2]MDO3700452.1 PQQ-binding-like beta-propeller repeat protein [Micromonospora sp. C28SCA-DRY-2]
MTLIDLGELRDPPEPERSRPVRRPLRPAGRPLRSAVVLALVLATAAGATPPPARVAAVVPGSAAADAFVAGGRLYVAQPAEGVTDGTRDLVAYPLPERATATPQRPAPLWRVPLPGAGQLWGLEVRDGLLLLSAAGLNGFRGGDTMVFDADTGRLRWRQPGLARLDAAGRLLLETGGLDSPGRVRSVDLASGRALWSLPVPPEGVSYQGRDGLIEQLVLVPADGAVEVYDAGTGARLRREELPALPASTDRQVVGDLLVAIDRQTGRVAGYELDGLRRRWEVDLPLTAYLHPCGDLLCAAGRTGGIRALDPATGQERWADAGWTGLLPERDGRMLGFTTTSSGTDRVVVVDVATGRQLADLGAWQLVPSRTAEQRVVGTRPAPGGGLLVAELDAATGRARGHDVLRDVAGDCQVDGDLILCRRLRDGFLVRRLPG